MDFRPPANKMVAAAAARSRGEFAVPVLKVGEIVRNLQVIECECTEADILKPTAQHFQRTCYVLLEALGGVTREQLERPIWTQDIVEHAELHTEAVTWMGFFTRM